MIDRPDPEELEALEQAALTPIPVNPQGFNLNAEIPYGCNINYIKQAMNDFIDFLGFINQQLYTRQTPRLEGILMAANFSSVVGEYLISTIPKYCSGLVKNRHHNGHPDLVASGYYPDDDVLHGEEGIEVKASRYLSGWQGHNREACWLMVFVFDCNGPNDFSNQVRPKPFRFVKVSGARLTKEDWSYSGRTGDSRRTITSSVIESGYNKMMSNWIYQDPSISPKTRLRTRLF